jgi:hypothetical protein
LPWSPEVPSSGFGYPLDGSKLSLPREPLSAPNAHELRPSEPCLLPGDRKKVTLPLSAPAFSRKTLTGLAPTLQRLDPTRKAVPLICNPTFYVGSGTCALMGLTTSQALPPKTLPMKHLPSRLSLSALPIPKASQPPGQLALRSLCLRPGISLKKGHRPV